MIKYFCDKCGKEQSQDTLIRLYFLRPERSFIRSLINIRGDCAYHCDLCSACEKEVAEFAHAFPNIKLKKINTSNT